MEHPDLPPYFIDELLVEKEKAVRLIHRLEELIEQETQQQQAPIKESPTYESTSQ